MLKKEMLVDFFIDHFTVPDKIRKEFPIIFNSEIDIQNFILDFEKIRISIIKEYRKK